MNKSSPIYLLNVIPIESLRHDRRQKVVKLAIFFLNLLIDLYNVLFRWSSAIMGVAGILVFIAVYSFLPWLNLALTVWLSAFMLDCTFYELYEKALDQKAVFVAFGMSLFAFYMIQFCIQSFLDGVEDFALRCIQCTYSGAIKLMRETVISMYREAGWDVLQLIAKQQLETAQAWNEVGIEHNIPQDIMQIINEFAFDKDLIELSFARHVEQKDMNDKMKKKTDTVKPFHIFQMYSSGMV